jgi:aminopeptidase YwaD
MKKYINIMLTLFVVMLLNISVQSQSNAEITIEELKEHITYLASDELKGRLSGTPEGLLAAKYIRDQIKPFMTLLGEDGFQYFNVVTDVKLGSNNKLSFGDFEGVVDESFAPYSFSKSTTVKAKVVFVGYGLEIDSEDLKWNDYENIDVKGKWVLILRGDPENSKEDSKFLLFADDRDKVLTARDKGAAGVIFVSGKNFDAEDKLVSLYFDKTSSDAGLPVIHLKREVANQILSTENTSVIDLETSIDSLMQTKSFKINLKLAASTEIIQQKVKTQNVVGLIEGNDPVLKNEYVVIGAHYDHLGMGGQGSGSREPDVSAPHNGADDNASGVAGIIEIAEKLASMKKELKRSIVFIAFDAEEMGLLGSTYFTKHSLVDVKSVKSMFNFDMIGRLDKESNKMLINGTGTSAEAESILNKHKEAYDLVLAFSPEGYGPSDHAAFYSENIPVFFFTTGAHGDYHTPADDTELLNIEGEKVITDFATEVIIDVANRSEELSFQIAGPKKQARYGRALKVTLGIMPDFTSTEENGLGVGAVTPDRPAHKAGMLKNDRIVAIDGKAVKNIYDYMNRLKKLKSGQVISVDVVRGEKEIVLVVQL